MDWFSADKEGLSRLMKRRGMAWALYEVVQNGLDQNVTRVNVELHPIAGVPQVWLTCEDDDPDGFENLALAWTLFADTGKRSDPTKAGRFTMGEKMVLALALEAKISTTTGTVLFDKDGRRVTKTKRDKGSRIEVRLPMTRVEFEEVCKAARCIIPRPEVTLTFNGEKIPEREPALSFECSLQTEFADEEKFLRRTRRKTKVTLFKPLPGEAATLYELGLPIVELDGGDTWHIHVHQRVPLNVDRDNVTPAYLRELRTFVLNNMFNFVKGDDATAGWVRDACGSPECAPEAVTKMLTERFGPKRVIYDPTDVEGTKIAVSHGYTVISGGALSAEEWKNVKASGAALPAGQVTPSPKPFSPDGQPLKILEPEKWTPQIRNIVDFATKLGARVLNRQIRVTIADDAGWPFNGTYGGGHLRMNLAALGAAFFASGRKDPGVLRFLIHEFSHEFSSDHLSSAYHDAICKVGAAVALAALQEPALFHLEPV